MIMNSIYLKKTALLLTAVLTFCPCLQAQEILSLSLDDCRKQALQQSETLQQAGNKLQQAELDQKIAAAAYLPKLDGSATGTYIFPDMDMMGMKLQMRGMYMAGISLTQPLYAGGKIRTGQRLARIGEQAAREQVRLTQAEVILEAENAYWTLIAVKSKVRMLEAYHAQMDSLYRQVETSVQAGFATDDALLRIESERSEISYQLQKARGGANLCRLSLCRLLGLNPDIQIEPADTAIHISAPEKLHADISNRPELHLLQQQAKAAHEQIQMKRADMLPTVGLVAGYTYYGNIKMKGSVATANGVMPYTEEFRDGLGALMLSVQVPLFEWGAKLKKVKKAQLEAEHANLEMQKNKRLLELEVQQALQNLNDGYRLVQTAELALKRAQENLRVTENRYSVSMAILTDLLDAESQKQQAESNLIEAKTQYKIYEADYKRAIGAL